MDQVLIIGGNGGIGYGLVSCCLGRDHITQVHGTYRVRRPSLRHPRLQWHKLDAGDENQISLLAEQLDSVNVLINAAGLLHNEKGVPEKSIRQLSPEFFMDNIKTNTLPSLLLAKYFQKPLKAAGKSLFAVVSAKVGSIEDNRLGGWYSYRASKAALNMAMKTLSIEWQRSMPQSCVALFHPGTTDTPLSKPFQAHVPEGKLFTPEQSANYILEKLFQLKPEDSGRFWSWDGSELPW